MWCRLPRGAIKAFLISVCVVIYGLSTIPEDQEGNRSSKGQNIVYHTFRDSNLESGQFKAEERGNYSGRWDQGGLWEFGLNANHQTQFLPAGSLAEQNQLPFELLFGKSILVIGGSTSRDLAADFMQAVLPLDLQRTVQNQWESTNAQGYQLFPRIGKTESNFDRQYNKNVMLPLMNAGWRFEHQDASLDTSGCKDCNSNYRNIDYVATFQNISYEFSWKPNIFAPFSDTEGFLHRFCLKKYSIVYFGRGLHDAAFLGPEEMTWNAIEERFKRLANLTKCLPDDTLIILRSPYVTTASRAEQQRVEIVTLVLSDVVNRGFFDSSNGVVRSILVNGILLSSSDGSPTPFDGHHYDSRMARSLWRIIFTIYAAKERPSLIDGVSYEDIVADVWKDSGFGRS